MVGVASDPADGMAARSRVASLFALRRVIRQFAGGDPLGGFPVSVGDVVLKVLAADAPVARRADL